MIAAHRFYPVREAGRNRADFEAHPGWALCPVGSSSIVALGFLLELAWAFVGSIGLHLGTAPVATPLHAYLWLGGALVIAALAAVAAILAP